MKTLRTLHLYLGCLFAPMIVFFCVSGLWQRFGIEYRNSGWARSVQSALALLSTLHTGRGLKNGATLSSTGMTVIVVTMAVALIFTVGLGVVMAFRFGHKRAAVLCLLGGVVLPLVLCLATMTSAPAIGP